MIHVAAVLAQIVLLTIGAVHAVAGPSYSADGLQIDGRLDSFSNAELIDAIIAMAPAKPNADLAVSGIEPSASGIDRRRWAETGQSVVAYPITTTISVEFDYQLEEIEELTAQHIEMGTAGVDYTSHKVLVRAHWQFDLIP
jgi:hypothetical protein